MKKARIKAFTDAVVAIIMTIMVLEIKAPEDSQFSSMLVKAPYYIAFAISFLFACTAWYNHPALFSNTSWFSKKSLLGK